MHNANETCRNEPTQADIAVFKALSGAPDAEKYVNASRWYNHIASYKDEADKLPGDASKPYSTYGPEVAEETPAAKPAAEDDDDVDLFGSDDEDEAEKEALAKKRLEEAQAKKTKKAAPGEYKRIA